MNQIRCVLVGLTVLIVVIGRNSVVDAKFPAEDQNIPHQVISHLSVREISAANLPDTPCGHRITNEIQEQQVPLVQFSSDKPTIYEGTTETKISGYFDPSPGQVQEVVSCFFGEFTDDAIRVIRQENFEFDPFYVHNNGATRDYGLFQINGYWHQFDFSSPDEMLNYVNNIREAYKLFIETGYTFWYHWRAAAIAAGAR
jgi:hypothetical protein